MKKYDKDGYDKDGYDKNGYDRDGYRRDGYNRKGFNRDGIHKLTGTKFNPYGLDADGYGKSGFKNGLNRFGFNKDHKHAITGSEVDEQGYNFYGLDSNGCDRAGLKDPDVAMLEDYLAEKSSTPKSFATKNNLEVKEVKARLETAMLKAPWLQAAYNTVTRAGQAKRLAAIRKNASVVKTSNDLKTFWETHPKLDLNQLHKMFGNEVFIAFIDILAKLIKENSINIELLIRSFSLTYFDLEEGLSELNSLRRTADKETRFKIITIEKYMKKFSTKTFHPGTYIIKGVPIVVTEDDIKRGEEELKNARRFICAKTLEEVCLR